MSSPSIFVRVRDDAHARIAWAVASLPNVGPVGMLGRKAPATWRPQVVSGPDPDESSVVCDPDPDDPGRLWVVAGGAERPAVTHASIEGLARCLAARLGDGSEAVWTAPGPPARSGTAVRFPPPVGTLYGGPGAFETNSGFAGAAGVRGNSMLACVDDRPFMEAICLAAGAAVADDTIVEPTPVWERGDRFVDACEWLGLVVAESISD